MKKRSTYVNIDKVYNVKQPAPQQENRDKNVEGRDGSGTLKRGPGR